MSLNTQIVALATAIGADVKILRTAQGTLASLPTTNKDNLVAAIAELYTLIPSAGVAINDTAGNGNTTVTWSADKIYDTVQAAIVQVKSDLTNGATTALDTLSELGTALGNDANFAATMATSLGARLRFDAAQTLTTAQQDQALANLGITDYNYVTDYSNAKA